MKILKILSNPILYLASFSFVLISGEHFGGFYLLYILLGLPQGSLHAVLAIAGIAMLLVGLKKFKGTQNINAWLNIGSVLCFISSLIVFFVRDKNGYNIGTFEQGFPMLMLSLFGLMSINFLLFNLMPPREMKRRHENLSML